MNFFESRTAAERYARGRPFFHPLVIGRVREFLSLTKPVRAALDIGCGTGLSSMALRDIAQNVAAVDLSPEMVSQAKRSEEIHYLIASAERLPFGKDEFDLITISQVFHWLDRARFFGEAEHVLKDTGWLVVYDNYLSDEMTDNPRYSPWFRDVFLERYPTPPRNLPAFDPGDTEKDGFFVASSEVIKNTISFTLESFVRFLLTLTNVIAAVEGGRENADGAARWLTRELTPFFEGDESFTFTAPIWFLTSSPRHSKLNEH
jgi:SAM-dependent methyltransferase